MSGDRLHLFVESAVDGPDSPAPDLIESCVRRALAGVNGELAVRIVDEAESARLNERFRGAQGPTNVLAFPAGETLVPDSEPKPLGDIVICGPVVAREAAEQGKPLDAHWAHIVVHGCLHLRGFDHELDADAEAMEQHERSLLAELGIADPYRGES